VGEKGETVKQYCNPTVQGAGWTVYEKTGITTTAPKTCKTVQKNEDCKFPFTANGKQYDACSSDGPNAAAGAWCATSSGWGTCPSDKSVCKSPTTTTTTTRTCRPAKIARKVIVGSNANVAGCQHAYIIYVTQTCGVAFQHLYDTLGKVATKQQATVYKQGINLKMGRWDVCHLDGGQIDGAGHGGRIEDKPQAGHNCAVMCGAGTLTTKPAPRTTVGPPTTTYTGTRTCRPATVTRKQAFKQKAPQST